ncbi:hypothetical protein HD806DRAFT_501173 [Xylariaceae sp. AK1471]|nr:hypothetical protein HD806DRAFT_501173 [Xylariaceae sp. AK1471]
MADAAGLVIGAISLVVTAVEHYEKAIQAARDYREDRSLVQELRCRILIQQYQLEATLQSIGLSDPTEDELVEAVRKHFPGKYQQFVYAIQNFRTTVRKLMEKLDVDETGKPKWTSAPPERVRWEWRRVKRSFERSAIEKIERELEICNNALRTCFERPEIPRQTERPSLARIRARFELDRCDSLRENAASMYQVIIGACNCHCPTPYWSNLKLTWHNTESELQDDNLSLAISHGPRPGLDEFTGWRGVRIKLQPMRPVVASQAPTMPPSTSGISSKGKEPIIPRNWFNNSLTRSASKQRVLRSQSQKGIVLLPITRSQDPAPSLPPTLCSLFTKPSFGCLEINDPSAAASGLVECDVATSTNGEFTALRSLLANQNSFLKSKTFRTVFSKADRLAMCAGLCWGVLLLSGSPWMTSEASWAECINILWSNASGQRPSGIDCPSISSYFPSAVDDPSGSSDTQKELYFSEQASDRILPILGVLLIQISLGIANDEIGFAANEATRARLAANFENTNKYVQQIYLDFGHSFGDAVQRCVFCSFSGPDTEHKFESDRFRSEFYNQVAVPIQTIYEHMIPVFL